jgi:hypothetical protein
VRNWAWLESWTLSSDHVELSDHAEFFCDHAELRAQNILDAG